MRARLRAVLALAAAGAAIQGGGALARMGFYVDDWPIVLGPLESQARGTLASLKALFAASPVLAFRPLDGVIWWVEHALFGLSPLGWHLALAAGTVLVSALLYVLLRARGASEAAALGATLAFAAWPSKDSVQYWPVMTLTLAAASLWLVSELLRRRWEESGDARLAAGAALCWLASLGFYEQTLFLPLAWLADGRPDPAVRRRRLRAAAFYSAGFGAFLVWRLAVPRLFALDYPRGASLSPRHLVYVYLASIHANLGPVPLLHAARDAASRLLTAPAAFLAAVALPFAALAGASTAAARRGVPLYGLAVYALAYLPIALSDYNPSPLDYQNRLNYIPLLGLALAGAELWDRRPRARPAAWAALASIGLLLAAAGTAAAHWAEAARRQDALVEAVAARRELWPAGRTLLIRLESRFVHGKAPVFDSPDAASGAVARRLGKRLPVELLGPGTLLLEDGIDNGGRRVAYRDLILLDERTGLFSTLDRASARRLPPPL